ncbi:HET-domain-containing protein [Lentinus tigrinus ALCF2SS1-7]|uniref:HET-domain-containing protein n=1 Tax=Lentinus tigrinus ALCF2SS1-6 TaxID=1328759 RepID=A0A5C2RRZ1_9APHY|nr:HET-domain-containing protein [Lentinus tigrinus ALCF2SS1-6]RPD68202.1 HET-domain-containing protein [Lentinus tigrinus ALCF2SS1-7]
MSDQLCYLCLRFTTDLIQFDFRRQERYDHPWTTEHDGVVDGSWGPGFHHHETLDALTTSSTFCPLCSLILDVVATLPPQAGFTTGWLGLYPWASRLGEQTGTSFITVFSASVRYTYWGGFLGKIPPQVLNICSQRPWTRERCFPPHSRQSHLTGGAPGMFRHIPSTADDPAAFDTARAWLQECIDNHGAECKRGSFVPPILPGMLLDLGTHTPRLCSPSTSLSYTALTHCWGGEVPSRTLLENVDARRQAIHSAELPVNFRDAIRITQKLGIRYLWIDALCIIQDDDDDWRAEAAKMAAIYSGATVVLSAMDSESSTAGILKPEGRISSVRLDEKHTVQRNLPLFHQNVASSPLNRRGWCMQERLLGPAILHYGKHQLFWECRAYHAYEDGRLSPHGGTLDGDAGRFITLRQNILLPPTEGWKVWYRLIEEYSSRALTRPSDKLPALAGAAAIFHKAHGRGTYIAGLWKEDIVQGLIWGAHYHHFPSRKVPGYLLSDACAELTKPPTRRAPSWSWASVDGHVIFGWTTHPSFYDLEVLHVEMSVGLDDYVEPAPAGSLVLRAKVAEALYVPVDDSPDGGALLFEVGDGGSEPTRLTTCVMDFDRRTTRACWVASIILPSSIWALLVLSKRTDGCFGRIGLCISWDPMSTDKHSVLRQRFVAQDIALR